MQNHLSKPTLLILQNVTPLRKSAPWPPNLSHEHVFCTAPATENASLQIIFKCPMPAIFCRNAAKPSCFAHFWQDPQPSCACHAKRHLSLQKWSEPLVFLTSWLQIVLRATTACTFSTSQLPKVVRSWCFVHFDLEMCFAPQRRALFRHLNFQKSSDTEVFCTFWLPNVLRATTACNFSSLLWPAGSAPAALASLLFDPPEPQIIGKTQWIATFLPFRASASSFFLLFFFYSSFF